MPQFGSSSHSQSNFSDSNENLLGPFSHDEASQQLLNIPRSASLLTSAGWPAKRVAVDPLLLSGGASQQSLLHQVEQLGPPNAGLSQPTNLSQTAVSLPPFPGRECSINQEPNNDPQNHNNNNILFGVNIDNSNLLGISNPFASSNDFSMNPMLTPSSCIENTGFIQSLDNTGQTNPQSRTFVKVYKSGCFGRSLDIGKFSSYHELRGELAQMFGLEGQLEDPLRSGWQLVFVDRENDVLLLGDDPWPEFVSSVWCIKILSPQEVQQMGKQGLELLNNSVPMRTPTRQESMNLSTGVASVSSLEY